MGAKGSHFYVRITCIMLILGRLKILIVPKYIRIIKEEGINLPLFLKNQLLAMQFF